MVVPPEINMINDRGTVFRARISECQNETTGQTEFLYDPKLQALQYRVVIPGMDFSMIIQDVLLVELRRYMKDGKPIKIKRYGDN